MHDHHERDGVHRRSRIWGRPSAFLALFLDNVGVLVFMSAILMFTFNYPAEINLKRMIPGRPSASFSEISSTHGWRPLRRKKRADRRHGHALGLDTPSSIGSSSRPGTAYIATKNAELTWQIGMATLFMIGLAKVALSFFGAWVQRIVPTAGILGSLAGIGLLLLGFLPLLEIFNEVVVGMVALGLIFAALLGRMELPGASPASSWLCPGIGPPFRPRLRRIHPGVQGTEF
jgi:AGZA family xanthine/uracil permease-like MFS transporter